MLGSAFPEARFHPVGSIGNAVGGNGLEQLLVDVLAQSRVVLPLLRQQRLEGLEGLDRSLETD